MLKEILTTLKFIIIQMNNKIEYFQINDVNNVLAIQHYITKKKGKEEKKYYIFIPMYLSNCILKF